MLEYDDFMSLVADMRQAQKDYFKTRDKAILRKAKELEQKVDQQVSYWNQDKLPNLF